MAILIGVLIVALVIAACVAGWRYAQHRRSARLQGQFGPEYDRALQASGDRTLAEQELTARQTRVEQMHLRPLAAADQTRYAEAWAAIQSRFVDDPAGAITTADQLIGEVMQARGYLMGDFEARAADLSVSYPEVVSNYRAAYRIAGANQQGQASTEQRRQALVHYRTLFADLLQSPPSPWQQPQQDPAQPMEARR